MKSKRQGMILEIVSSMAIDTQEKLREALTEKGIEVTQATLSRDIRELGLIKEQDKYCVPPKNQMQIPALLRESVTEIDHAVNTVVFKCHAGMAMAACATFDKLEYSGVVGTLAGDDTIFILMRSEKDASNFVRQMRSAVFREKRDLDAQ